LRPDATQEVIPNGAAADGNVDGEKLYITVLESPFLLTRNGRFRKPFGVGKPLVSAD
jgi:hypothetical protein